MTNNFDSLPTSTDNQAMSCPPSALSAAMKGRLDQLANATGMEPFQPKYDEDGEILVTQEIVNFIGDHWACFNWIYSGEEKHMPKWLKSGNLRALEFAKKIIRLDDTERQIFLAAMREFVAGEESNEVVKARLEKKLDEYNASKKA